MFSFEDGNLLWSAKSNQSVRVRATVCRDHDNRPVTTSVSLRSTFNQAFVKPCTCIVNSNHTLCFILQMFAILKLEHNYKQVPFQVLERYSWKLPGFIWEHM